jgi:L-alanine-DL-glutamate epimerase-like enolase superfamily enzyme
VADGRRQHIWVSGRDLAQLIRIDLESNDVNADVVYGVSSCPAPFFQNRRAVELGHVPQDQASDNVAADFVPREQMPESSGPNHVGGPYVSKRLIVGVAYMKIKSLETRIIEIPFEDGGKGLGITPSAWKTLETVLVRVEDTDGNIGWGEGFGYFVSEATRSIIETRIKRLLEGATVESVEAWTRNMQRLLHIFGRYGVTMFAISGVDMALWDLKAKRAGVPLYHLLGGSAPASLTTYASLVRYGDAKGAAAMCEQALSDGFNNIKLHEIDMPIIEACHASVAGRAPISVDVNCAWDIPGTKTNLQRLRELGGIEWLEEPIFPPEDFDTLGSLRAPGVPLAAGENWCTAMQFRQAVKAGAVDYLQPSVSKVGGVTEFVDILGIAREAKLGVLPHSPYFGPGFLATLHLATAFPETMQVEYLYVDPAAWPIDLAPIRNGHTFRVTDAPGIGLAPDESAIGRFLRAR